MNLKGFVLLFVFHLLFSVSLSATNYPVTNTLDTGAGSLREAITLANVNPGRDTISFNIPGVGVKTLVLASPLPAIIDTLLIDGSTDPGYVGLPLIEINGDFTAVTILDFEPSAAESEVVALVIHHAISQAITVEADNFRLRASYIGTDATGSTVQMNGNIGIAISSGRGSLIGGDLAGEGNVISGHNTYGIYVSGNASSVSIKGNMIGTDVGGTTAIPNGNWGLASFGDSLQLGGLSLASRNIISGNQGGITNRANHCTFINNYIGVDITGTVALENTGDGILLRGDSNTIGGSTPAQRNIVSGNTGTGIKVFTANTTRTRIQGNFIGTDRTGTLAIANRQSGMEVHSQSTEVSIGGINPGEGNVISGNQPSGISLFTCNKVYFYGNFIGTDLSGTLALPNTGSGINIYNGSMNIVIGDGTPAGANVISANLQSGINANNGSDSLVVKSNYMGTDPSGLINLGNGDYGISLVGASVASIGGNLPGEGNLIANNLQGGVLVSTGSNQNRILGNSIYDHTGLGIRLNNVGNNAQEAPELTGYAAGPGMSTFFGVLNSAPNTTYRMEFFSSQTYNQGKTYLGSTTITTDAAGFYALNEVLPVTITAAEPIITATATDPDGNTSEFGIEIVLTSNILDFRAEEMGSSVVLLWETSDASSSVSFEVEQLNPQGNFIQLGTQHSFTQAGSNRRYHFPVENLPPGTHFFRLKHIEENGGMSYSRILSFQSTSSEKLSLSFPNPLHASHDLILSTAKSQAVEIGVYDMRGAGVVKLFEGKIPESVQSRISCQKLQTLSPGLYMLEVKGPGFKECYKVCIE